METASLNLEQLIQSKRLHPVRGPPGSLSNSVTTRNRKDTLKGFREWASGEWTVGKGMKLFPATISNRPGAPGRELTKQHSAFTPPCWSVLKPLVLAMSYPLLRAPESRFDSERDPRVPFFIFPFPVSSLRLCPFPGTCISGLPNGIISSLLSLPASSRYCDASVGSRRLGFLVWREARQ